MSKKQRAKNKAKTATAAPVGRSLSRKKLLMIVGGVIALLLAAVSIQAYESGQQELHDLSVIGQGKPVLVQVHDPSCPTCRRLKKIVSSTLDSSDPVLYRVANITTESGKALADKYSVPKVTLLFFNGRGKHVHTTSGLQTTEQLDSAINEFLRPTS